MADKTQQPPQQSQQPYEWEDPSFAEPQLVDGNDLQQLIALANSRQSIDTPATESDRALATLPGLQDSVSDAELELENSQTGPSARDRMYSANKVLGERKANVSGAISQYYGQKYRESGVGTAMGGEGPTSEGGGSPLGAPPPSIASETTTTGEQLPENLRQQREALFDTAERLRMTAIGHRGNAATYAHENAMRLHAQRQAMDAIRQGGEEEAREHMRRISAAYDEADVDMASLRVNPNRWEEDTPALAQVFMALGSAAFSFFNGANGGGGANPIVQLIEGAIERDIQAQMKNIEIQLGRSANKLEKEEVMGKLQGNIRAAMYERALNTYEGILQQGQAGVDLENAAAALTELTEKSVMANVSRFDPYVQKYTTKYTAATGSGGMSNLPGLQKIDMKSHERVAGTPAAVEDLRNTIGLWVSADKGGTGITDKLLSFIPGTVEYQYDNIKGAAAMTEGIAQQGGRSLSDADRESYERTYPGLMSDGQTAYTFFQRKILNLQKNMEGVIRSNQGRADTTTAHESLNQVLELRRQFEELAKQKGWVK